MASLHGHRYSNGPALALGLGELLQAGLSPRDLLFLALGPRGDGTLVVPEDRRPQPRSATTGRLEDAGATRFPNEPSRPVPLGRVRVGEKLTIGFPFDGPYYHYDSIHLLRPGLFLYNGDCRLAQPGNADDMAGAVTQFLRECKTDSVFFGCTPHRPGTWIASRAGAEPLHELGFVEALPIGDTLVARRVMDNRLWQLRVGDRLSGAQAVFESQLGNILMVERRVVGERLVLTCEEGLIEVDVSLFPWVMECARAHATPGFAVVGRIGNEAFAVTRGTPELWGLDGLGPAQLIGAAGGSLVALAEALAGARGEAGIVRDR